jgi:hypothetical protein
MRRIARSIWVLFVFAPNVLGAQTLTNGQAPRAPDEERPRRFSIHAAAGSTLQERGSVLSLSLGFSPARRFTVLVGGERTYLPTRVTRYPDGGSAAMRGGTLQLVSVEMRFALRDPDRISPYIAAGFGGGVSRPNVNEFFRDEVRNNAGAGFVGGGVNVPLGSWLSAFADVRFSLHGEKDVIMPLVPVRGGVAWRF